MDGVVDQYSQKEIHTIRLTNTIFFQFRIFKANIEKKCHTFV